MIVSGTLVVPEQDAAYGRSATRPGPLDTKPEEGGSEMDDWEPKAQRRDAKVRNRNKSKNWPVHGGSLRDPNIAARRRLSRVAQLALLARRAVRRPS